jgi:CBS domain-containing protein
MREAAGIDHSMKQASGATPLYAIEAVAIDTETTGLDPASARIVELAALHISGGRIAPQGAFEAIVDPGVEMPAKAVEIHGIDASKIAGKPGLKGVWSAFSAHTSGRVFIGHSIGFDLALLEAEARRHRLPWRQPRFICVRLLAAAVAPDLANHSLDALAAWLGVEIENRHRALGDAQAAGQVFLAMLPMLRQAGIRTLAEAERASRKPATDLRRQAEAGWAAPSEGAAPGPLGAAESHAYRHRVGEIMAHPPLALPAAATLKQAIDTMAVKAVSSVFVSDSGETGEDLSHYGILTERDAMRRIAARGAQAFELKLGDIASRPLASIREEAFLYRAIARMSRLKYRHLAVRSADNRLVGIVSARDLLKQRASPAIALDDRIEDAKDTAELAVAWSGLAAMVSALLAEEIDPRIVCGIVSEEIRAMTRRAAVLAEARMHIEGNGAPPAPYCVMVLGSGGRGESMLVPDQDNAIVWAGEDDSGCDSWFAQMAGYMADILDGAGIPYCKGGVMAKNEQWRGSLRKWFARVDHWVSQSTPQDILNVDIFYDAAAAHGDGALVFALMNHAYEAARANTGFAKMLGQSLESVPNPFTMFGGLRGEGGRLDLKMYGLFPIAAAARALAIRHDVRERSTRGRLEGLIGLDIGARSDLEGLVDAHAFCLGLVLRSQGEALETGHEPSNFVDHASLTKTQKSDLKEALRQVEVIPELMRGLLFAQRR